jgi:hypothetical protein
MLQVQASEPKPRRPRGLSDGQRWDVQYRCGSIDYAHNLQGGWEPLQNPDISKFKWRRPPSTIWLRGLHQAVSNLYRGTDPEFFLWDGMRRVPAFEVLPDKKRANPWFWDGFQAETTIGAETCHECTVRNISGAMKVLKGMGLKVHPSTSWKVPNELLQTASDSHVALGCDASYNAYRLKGREVPIPRLLPWRSCGGHLHFQMAPEEREDWAHVVHIVKSLDLFLGVPSVALFQNVDQRVRRFYYGLPGEFRLPPHGLEYRVLSNAWAWHPQSTMLIFDMARQAFAMGRAHFKNMWIGSERQAIECIQYGDVRLAQELTRANKWYFEELTGWRYQRSDTFWRAIERGIDQVIPDFGRDIVEQWQGIEHYRDAPKWRSLSL